jgi:hypothetical protein
LDQFKASTASTQASIEPAKIPLLQEIGADKYFIRDSPEEISSSIRENPLTPAVTQQKLQPIRTERTQYIEQITQLRNLLDALGIKASVLQPGDAEIGFLLPRSLFNNRLDQLIKELRDINRIIRAFSETTIGRVEEVEVRDISTSDPLFFFHLTPITIAGIGAAVTWSLNTWKQVEEIRRVRAEIRKTDVLTEKEITDLFDKKITDKISAAIDAKVDELLKDDGTAGRVKEQRTDLKWALESILAHVEQGMIVEIRFVPPPAKAPEGGSPDQTFVPPEFAQLEKITSQLVFPRMEGPPILKLPPQPVRDSSNE